MQKSPHVHKSMVLRGVIPDPRKLNDMDFEVMRRHASTHDRINGFTWQSNNSRGNGNGRPYSARPNGGYTQDSGNQPMRSYPPGPTPGVPPPNAAASQWYQQTSSSYSNGSSGSPRSGVMRLDDLSAMFADNNQRQRDPRRDDRGYYGNRGNNSGGSGYYQGYDSRYGGSGSGYGRR